MGIYQNFNVGRTKDPVKKKKSFGGKQNFPCSQA
jgi:hypothetical protein